MAPTPELRHHCYVEGVENVLLYDGECGLCDGLLRFSLNRDKHGRIHYAAIQSDTGRAAMARHGMDPDRLDTAVLLTNYDSNDEKAHTRSRAILGCMWRFGGLWHLTRAFWIIPKPLADLVYRFIADRRHKWFAPRCMIPTPEEQARFVAFHAGSAEANEG